MANATASVPLLLATQLLHATDWSPKLGSPIYIINIKYKESQAADLYSLDLEINAGEVQNTEMHGELAEPTHQATASPPRFG